MKRIFLGLGAAMLLLAAVLVVNTLRVGSPEESSANTRATFPVDADGFAQRMAESVRFETISHQDPGDFDRAEFADFVSWLQDSYPQAAAVMKREMVGGLTPIYLWEGADPVAKPILLTGHYDVVPASENTLADWDVPPFSGVISDGFVWGRGTLDDKIAVIGLMEAAEHLIARGFTPPRNVYFVFGHDEEVGGLNGAARAVALFRDRGIEIEWSLDEGSMVLDGLVPGVEKLVASVNVAEKGYVTLDITAKGQAGHSSLPPADTAVGVLAEAITRLEANPVPGGLTGLSADFFDQMLPEFPFLQRMLFANRWLFGPLIESELGKSAATNAMLRTTTAPTMLSASVKENVLPSEAVATVNFRIHPRDSIDSIVDYVTKVIDDDRVEISLRGEGLNPSPVSSHETAGFAQIGRAAVDVFGDVTVVPGLTIAATDVRHYRLVAENSYRLNPIVFQREDIPRIHGVNERISLENIENVLRFYVTLIESL